MDHDNTLVQVNPRHSSKLCPRHTTRLKKSCPTEKGFSLREETMFKKASELSTLCDTEVCVLHYDRDGSLANTWPHDQSKVYDMPLRYSRLKDKDRHKKRTNLSNLLNKRLLDQKTHSLRNNDTKFYDQVWEMKGSVQSRVPILQDIVLRLQEDHKCQSLSASTTESLAVPSSSFFIKDPPQPSMNHLSDLPTSSLDQHPNKFSLFLYNHDNSTFTSLPSTYFDQSLNNGAYLDLLLDSQDSNNNIPLPLMHTQNPLVHFDNQSASWTQTPTF